MPAANFSQVARMLRTASLCPTCRKSLAVVNLAGHGRPFRGEAVSPFTHCTCVGGPAYVEPIDLPAFVVAILDGAIGDDALPFPSFVEACTSAEKVLTARVRRELTGGEWAKLRAEVVREWDRRHAVAGVAS